MKLNNYSTMPAIFLLAVISFFTFLPQQSDAQSVVISQVYGGGGNSGATYTNDFVELFNRGTTTQSLSGWSIQYASSAGTSWTNKVDLTGTIQPGQYFLIQLAGGATGNALPTPDLTGSINMSATAGKIALLNTIVVQSGTCPASANIIDFVGFGTTANCFEGTGPTPAPSNSNAVLRANSGCTDTNNNSADFSAGTPTPRNSQSPLNFCSVACVAPVITCPGNINVSNAAGQCGINLPFMTTATGTSPTITYSHAPGSFFPVGTTIVTATATNACGTDQCTFTVTVNDTEPPVASCQNVSVSVDANGVALLTTAMVNNNSSDNCPGSLTYTLSRTNFSCSDIGAGTTINATDLFISEYIEGSSNNKCIEIFNGTGATVDLAVGGYQLKIYANGAATPTSTTNLSGVIADGDVFVICNTSATIDFTSHADQLSGNISFNGDDAVELFKSSSNQTLDIFGEIGVDPGSAWTSGSLTTLNSTLRRISTVMSGNTINGSGFPTLSTEWDGYATDNADNLGSHIYSPAGSGIPVTLTVTDAAGNSSTCTAEITVIDDLAPVANCQNVTVYLDANGVETITDADINLNSSDNCNSFTLSIDRTTFSCNDLPQSPSSTSDLIISEYVEGSGFNKYIEIYNGIGSTVNLSNYELRLYSNGSPTISQSMNLGVAGNLASGATVVLSHGSATAYTGTTFVNSTVINFNGDDAVELFNLITNQAADIFGEIGVDPGSEWSVSGNSTADNTLRRKLSVTSGNATNSPGFPTLGTEWDVFPQDDVTGLGAHGSVSNTVALTVTDASGNSSICTASVTVLDTIAPVISGIGQGGSLDCNVPVLFSVPTASDNCGNPTLIYVEITTPGNCPQTFSITRTWYATDSFGNTTTASETINVTDNTAPVIAGVGADMIISCNDPVLFSSPTFTDDCDPNPNVNITIASGTGSCPQSYSVTQVWTATDACGNSSTASQTITVVDNTAPVINDVGANITITCPEIPANYFSSPTATDNCDPNVLISSTDAIIFGTCPQNYSVTRTWFATDACGNTATAEQVITIIDVTAPAISCPVGVIVCNDEQVNLGVPTVTDNCSNNIIVTNNAPATFPVGTTTVVWTATDECGNSSTCTQTVTRNMINAGIMSQQDVLCFGDNTGEVTIFAITMPQGNSNLQYSIQGSNLVQNTGLFTGLYAGVYVIEVVDLNTNCFTTVNVIIEQPAAALTVTTSSTNTCAGGNTGTLSATPSGGTLGYTVEWFDVNNVKLNNVNTVGAGNYSVIVTDANGCTATGTVTVNEHNASVVTLGDDKVVFYGALGFNGCHTLTANANGNGPFNYSWSSTDPNPAIISNTGSTLSVCVTSDMMYTYTVVVTDANGCTASASVNVIYTNIDCSSQQNAGKVTICRVPPGNPANCQTICVAVTAAQALINNGSYVGPCLPNCAIPQARAITSAPSMNNDVELNVYPNPTSGNVHIEYRSETDNAELIVITDLQGRTVKTLDIKGAFEFHGSIDVSDFDNGIYFINVTGNNSVIVTTKVVKAE